MERVLVTGGAGYIGSHCCKALYEAGFMPVVFDNLSTGHRDFVKWGPLIEGDIRDADAVRRAMLTTAPVAVMHFAAKSLVSQSMARPEETFEVNLTGTLNLLRAMLAAEVGKVVFSSTCAVYGVPRRLPLSEDEAIDPISPYGASKAMSERLFDDIGMAHGLESVRLRYFNAAGADRDGAIGEQHQPETHLIPIVFDVALGLRPALKLFGTDYETPDGTAVRDYIHVSDLAEVHIAALRHLIAGRGTATLNVGTGVGASVSEVVRMVERVTGRKVPVRIAPRRAGDPPILTADPTVAEEVLGWRSRIALDEMVEDAWRWHRTMRETQSVLT